MFSGASRRLTCTSSRRRWITFCTGVPVDGADDLLSCSTVRLSRCGLYVHPAFGYEPCAERRCSASIPTKHTRVVRVFLASRAIACGGCLRWHGIAWIRCGIVNLSCLRPIAGRSFPSQVSTTFGLLTGLEEHTYSGHTAREERRTRNSPVAMVETGVPLDDEQLRELVDRRVGHCASTWTAFEIPVSCIVFCVLA